MATSIKVSDNIERLPANPFAFEVLNLASKQRTNAKKAQVLREYNDPSLQTLLIWNFDETVVSMLPSGVAPYASTKEQTSFSGTLGEKIDTAVKMMGELGSQSLGSQDQGKTSIRKEYKYFYNFVKGGNDGLSSMKRETMFIGILEGLHPLEAEILLLVKDHNLQERYKITKKNVSDAFPEIKWGNRS
jgi:hypothetical protein|tara:strand:+ start:227 stop:790 length:564 start_codon:yes stop_codon:yes gene_type:complete